MPDKPQPIRPSVSKFQVPKSDEKREVSIGCRITWREKRLLDIMMREAKDKLPWVTESDFHYWCFLRGLSESSEAIKSERFTNLFKQLQMETELLKHAEERRKLTDMLKSLKVEVQARDELNAQNQVPPLLRNFEQVLASMEPTYWVERMKKEFYRDYGQRLKEGRISPRPRDAQKEDEDE